MKTGILKAWLAAALWGIGSICAAQAADPASHPNLSFTEARLIPIQAGGRTKPLDSFARDIVLFETGSRSFEGWDPVDLLLSWIADPHAWQDKAFIQISRSDVKRQLGLDETQKRFTPEELFKNVALGQYAREMMKESQQPGGMGKKDPRETELRHVLDRLGSWRAIVSGEAWTVIPKSAGAWASLAATDTAGESDGNAIRARFVSMIKAYQAGQPAEFEGASKEARAAVESAAPNLTGHLRDSIRVEAFYNRMRPFMWAWILYLLAALTWIGSGVRNRIAAAPSRALGRVAGTMMGAAVAIHVTGIALRCYVAGRPPVTNMYESVNWVMLVAVVFSIILYFLQRQTISLIVGAVVATFGLIAGDSAPAIMDPGINPLVPVLRSNYWLTIHVLTITSGYAAFALSMGLADVALFQFWRKGEGSQARIQTLNQLTYRAMQFGVVLLAAGTILGGIWADYSWGRFWGWDPKETWALIALLCYLTILHARFAGWVKQFGFAAWSVLSFLSVIMAWYGVNFVLGVGLHSYGFSTGGRGYVFGFVLLQLAYVVAVAVKHKGLATSSAALPQSRPQSP